MSAEGGDRPSNFYNQGGPPDPISYLRRISSGEGPYVQQRTDSADDDGEDFLSESSSGNADQKPPASKRRKSTSGRTEEPPARERPQPGQAWPHRENLSFTRSLIFYGAGAVTHEHEQACKNVVECRQLRKKYFGSEGSKIANVEALKEDNLQFRLGEDGVMELYQRSDVDCKNNLSTVPNVEEFSKDYHRMVEMVNEGFMRSYCFQRLQLLSSAFRTHVTMNGSRESLEQGNLLGTDFYRTMKIDNHIHAAGAPSAKQFVSFVRNKLETESDTVVSKDGKTLGHVFEEAGLDKDHLTIDAFNVLADYSVYQRFDNFNAKYSPFRMADMRRIFLKSTNYNGGRYFAELLKIVLNRHETSKGHVSGVEMRLSIYGMEREEWYDLAEWMLKDWGGDFPGTMISSSNRWMIQVPRLWRIFRMKPGKDGSGFNEMLENIFSPMFEATLYPEKHPKLAEALKHIVGFDSVDDEGAAEEACNCQRPHLWTTPKNPAYWWQLYFLWANLEVLNSLRRARGLNTIAFRPHAGETGNPMNLACTYMLCESIAHGINLDMQVSLQYLYYLDQVGLSTSPLSNNFLFRKMADSPFLKFFRRGLNITLSTDDPLLFHMSDDPLLEEYSVARATFDLSMTDMMEIARNSVLQSGFEEDFKEKYLGKDYRKGVTFCDEHLTHVPLIRAKFRAEHLAIEHMLCALIAAGKGKAVLQEMKTQFGLARDAHRNVLFDNLEEVPAFPEQGQL
jgi:AMP deaminase